MAGMFDGNATVDTTGSSKPISVSVVNGLSVSIGTVQIKDASDVVINPSTEETSQAIVAAINGLCVSVGAVQVKNSSDVVIDPATEQTALDILNALGGGGTSVNVYGEALAVSSGVATTIATYTVPIASNFALHHVDASGDIMGEFTVTVNTSVIAKRRTYFTHYNTDFFTNRDGISVASSQQVAVVVLHNRPSLGNFNASIYGVLS